MADAAAPPPLARGRRTLVAVVIAVVVAAIVIGLVVWRTNASGISFSARFSSSVGVYPGSDVRVLGVPVGKVVSVTPDGTVVKVGMQLDKDVEVEADTYAVVVSPNLVSDRYVQLTGAYDTGAADAGPTLRNGAVIPRDRTRTPVELDELTRNLTQLTTALGPNGANATGALSKLLKVGADNLQGNGKKINDTIRALGESGRTLDASKFDIFATIEQLSTFTTTLQQNDAALARVNDNFATVSQTFANDRRTFGEALRELGTALDLVQDFVRDNRGALKQNVDKLQTVAATLAKQRSSLAKTLKSAPLLLQNFLNAYDPENNLLRGRANLNELTVWADGGSGASSNSSGNSSGNSAKTQKLPASADAPTTTPPLMLPGTTKSGAR